MLGRSLFQLQCSTSLAHVTQLVEKRLEQVSCDEGRGKRVRVVSARTATSPAQTNSAIFSASDFLLLA